jgi:serine/threonine protein phosphatase 1
MKSNWLSRRTKNNSPPAPLARISRLPAGRRIYAVGDVHGRADLLASTFERIDAHQIKTPTVRTLEVYLGDYIDRGPDSRGVIDLLLWRKAQGNVATLLGNHEEMMLRALDDPRIFLDWLRWGGSETLLSYGLQPRTNGLDEVQACIQTFREILPKLHLTFLQSLAPYFQSGDYFFVHAGVRPGIPLDKQVPEDMLWIRDPFLTSTESFGAIVVHGHSPVPSPQFLPNRINIDTRAFMSNVLTCVALEGSSAYDLGDAE